MRCSVSGWSVWQERRVADLIRPQVDRFIFTRNFPLIVEIPDRQGPLSGKPGIREMVNQAIGIKL